MGCWAKVNRQELQIREDVTWKEQTCRFAIARIHFHGDSSLRIACQFVSSENIGISQVSLTLRRKDRVYQQTLLANESSYRELLHFEVLCQKTRSRRLFRPSSVHVEIDGLLCQLSTR